MNQGHKYRSCYCSMKITEAVGWAPSPWEKGRGKVTKGRTLENMIRQKSARAPRREEPYGVKEINRAEQPGA